jgi:glutathione S-transferase
MLELYQFELCPFCEKVRLMLDYKGLEYKKIEVTPGIGQLDLFQISGQRQVPVLKDGDTVVADSTKIALYLDDKYSEKPLIPSDAIAKAQCLLLEEWADKVFISKTRKAFIGALNQSQSFRVSLLPNKTPDILRNVISFLPSDFLTFIGTGGGLGNDIFREAENEVKKDLDSFTAMLQNQGYFTGTKPTLVDLTIAAMSTFLKFPTVAYYDVAINLEGIGIPGIADNPDYEFFFNWRDNLYSEYRQTINKSDNGNNNSNNQPMTIEID